MNELRDEHTHFLPTTDTRSAGAAQTLSFFQCLLAFLFFLIDIPFLKAKQAFRSPRDSVHGPRTYVRRYIPRYTATGLLSQSFRPLTAAPLPLLQPLGDTIHWACDPINMLHLPLSSLYVEYAIDIYSPGPLPFFLIRSLACIFLLSLSLSFLELISSQSTISAC